jgi:hypothetical protein
MFIVFDLLEDQKPQRGDIYAAGISVKRLEIADSTQLPTPAHTE